MFILIPSKAIDKSSIIINYPQLVSPMENPDQESNLDPRTNHSSNRMNIITKSELGASESHLKPTDSNMIALSFSQESILLKSF